MPDEIDISQVDAIVAGIGRGPESMISILQALQAHYRYLPQPALRRVCEITDLTPAAVTGVSSFYSQFRHQPVGEHMVHVCVGTACHVKGAERVHNAICRELGIQEGQDTDPAGRFTVEKVACLGCCTLAPVVRIDEVTYGYVSPDGVDRMLLDFLSREQQDNRGRRSGAGEVATLDQGEIRIGLGSCCLASGSGGVLAALEEAVAEIAPGVQVKRVACVGMCYREPLLEVVKPGEDPALYARIGAEDVRDIVLNHFQPRGLLGRIKARTTRWLENLYADETWESVTRYAIDVRDPPVAAFLGRQLHLATECCGVLDPTDLVEYRESDGFAALTHGLTELTPEQVIEEVTRSGLRGRGGAGFPTGRKWTFVRSAKNEPKYIVCNGDEGDPGAFMDRMLLESYPYRVIEGMILAAYAVGAHEGVFYIRAEYPLAVRRVQEALLRCEECGLLGDDILGTGFALRLRIMEGAGAFVCGEETALLASIEGKRGMPRLRPPFPAEQGLWGQPTLVNNCETYALVPWILRRGGDAFAAMGTERSKGTKVFSLAGKIARGGLIEVPMGITLREIVEEVGGGIADGRRLKAVQVGGPSGGCVPAELADTPVDYEALISVGAMMGSGGLVVLDETDCIVDIARYFLTFTQDQSCGKCTFCRVGTRRMLDILERLCVGEGKPADLDELEHLAVTIKQGSLCGLGRTAPNPVLSTLKYFREEYDAHVAGRCPAGSCSALICYSITDACIGCTRCAQQCPTEAISFTPYERHQINDDACIRCGACKSVCPANAVIITSAGQQVEWDREPSDAEVSAHA